MNAQELLAQIQQRIAAYEQRSNPDTAGTLKYSHSWRRRAANDALRIEELRWVEAQMAQQPAE